MNYDIGLIGGTGAEGRGLALRFAVAGRSVVIGSRSSQRAAEAVSKVADHQYTGTIFGATNEEAAQQASIAIIAVPYEGLRATLEAIADDLAGKLVVSVVAPLAVERGVFTSIRVPEGSAAQQAALLLPQSRVTACFHNLSARDLLRPQTPVDSDVFVFSDDGEAMRETCELVSLVPGATAVQAGGLANARYAEDLTALLLNINRIHRAHTSIRITGLQ